jgi:hypothetical protein
MPMDNDRLDERLMRCATMIRELAEWNCWPNDHAIAASHRLEQLARDIATFDDLN